MTTLQITLATIAGTSTLLLALVGMVELMHPQRARDRRRQR